MEQRRRTRRRLPRRGVRHGPARFELAVTACFIASMIGAVYVGGPTDLKNALAMSIPFFLMGLLVVRRELFAITLLPIFLSLLMGDSAGNEMHVGNMQVVFWLGSALLFLPVLIAGVLIRKTIDD